MKIIGSIPLVWLFLIGLNYTATAQTHQNQYFVTGAGDASYNGKYVPDGTTPTEGFLRWRNPFARYLVLGDGVMPLPPPQDAWVFTTEADITEVTTTNWAYLSGGTNIMEPPPTNPAFYNINPNSQGPAPTLEVQPIGFTIPVFPPAGMLALGILILGLGLYSIGRYGSY